MSKDHLQRVPEGTIHLAYGIDSKYLFPLCVNLTSVFMNKRDNKIIIHVVCKNVDSSDKQSLKSFVDDFSGEIYFYDPSEYQTQDFFLPEGSYFTEAIFYRLVIPDLLPSSIDRVIYLDTDTIVVDQISDLFNIGLNGMIVGACIDTQIKDEKWNVNSPDTPYFNSGVLVMDLVQWRKSGIARQTVNYLAEHARNLKYPDQDALNYILRDKWHMIDPKYNIMNNDMPMQGQIDPDAFLSRVAVLHFNNVPKPWEINCEHPFRFVFDRYASFFDTFRTGKYFGDLSAVNARIIVSKVFSEIPYSIESVLEIGVRFHLVWIFQLGKLMGKRAQKLLIDALYRPEKFIFQPGLLEDLQCNFEQNSSFFREMQKEIEEPDFPATNNPNWRHGWEDYCKHQIKIIKYNEDTDFHTQLISVPEMINSLFGLSGLTKTYIYFFVFKTIN